MTDEAGRLMRFEAAKKSVLVAYLLWFFLGWLGLHRFYLGYVISGLLMLALWGVGTLLTFILVGYVILVVPFLRSEEHTSELQSLMRISYAVFCLKKKNKNKNKHQT